MGLKVPVGSSRAYIYVCLSLYLLVRLVVCVAFWRKIVRPIIARSACGCRPQVLQYNICSSTSVCLSLCLVVCIVFWWSFARPIIARSACGRRPRGKIHLVAVFWCTVQYICQENFRLIGYQWVLIPIGIWIYMIIRPKGMIDNLTVYIWSYWENYNVKYE